MNMNYENLRKALKYEFKLITGQYYALYLGNERNAPMNTNQSIFTIDFCIDYSTIMFCTRIVEKGVPYFIIDKIVSLSFDGKVTEVQTIEQLVQYIKEKEIVELINPY